MKMYSFAAIFTDLNTRFNTRKTFKSSKRKIALTALPMLLALMFANLMWVNKAYGDFTINIGFSAANKCNPLAVDACGLPFPSDVFKNLYTRGYNFSNRILDRRVSGASGVVSPSRVQLPPNFRPSKIFNFSDGFSALGPVLFELTDWPDAPIPEDGEGYMHVYNMKTGERVPMIVSMSKAAQPSNQLRSKSPVIMGWPRTRFEFGERYIAVLYRDKLNASIQTTNGEDVFKPTEALERAFDGTAHPLNQLAYKDPLNAIKKMGIPRDNILSFTWFTVRTEAEVVEPMKKMIGEALSMPNYVRNLKKVDPIGDEEQGLATLHGEASMVNFRSLDGGVYPPYEQVEDNARRVTEFTLTLPKVENDNPIPISILGHGLGQDREFIKSGYVQGDRLGVATLAIDHPNHGSRASRQGVEGLKEPYIGLAITTPPTIMQLLGMFVQSTVDHNVLINTAKHTLPTTLANWEQTDIPNLPALDGSKVIFTGLSLSAMVGTAIGATAPDLQGIYLSNGAGSLMQVLTESAFWDRFTSNVIPRTMNGAQMMFVVAMMQHYLDIADGNNFAQFYRNPMPNQVPRPLAMHYSIGDGSVPNGASLATAELVGLPLLKDVIKPVPQLSNGVEGLDSFDNYFGLVQSPYGLQAADDAVEELKALDVRDELKLNNNNLIKNLFGIDVTALPVNLPLPAALQGFLSNGKENPDQAADRLIDDLYTGEAEAFATHFNRTNRAARFRFIEWNCGLLQLDPNRCENARQLTLKDIEEEERLLNEERNNRSLEDALNDRVNIQVTEASSGAVEYLLLLLLVGVGWIRFKYSR